ncbi:shieldin complex subunit 1 isoform X4 [Saimiri boliviensis]|uniref:shieldin complex subunit 1 isoform X4 n=1 Tax=Saimiri boliviensis TaxID=27679 RepID=UPI003D7826F3
MAAEDATSGSLSEESSALDLPSACDIRDYVLQRPSQDTNSEAFSSVEFHSFPCSSDVDPDTSNLNTEQNNSWASENFWLDPAVKGQSEKEEDDGLRKSLDRFYEMFGHPQPGSVNPLSASVCKCLSQKITQLRDQESQSHSGLTKCGFIMTFTSKCFTVCSKKCWLRAETQEPRGRC